MMQIINDILDDSKIEAGKMDLIRETFDVREFAEQVGQLFAGRAESKSSTSRSASNRPCRPPSRATSCACARSSAT